VINRPRFPETKVDYFPMKGGLDLVTAPIELPPGKVIDSVNYEPAPVHGYRRINGFERFDGRPAPSVATYWVMTITLTALINVGDTITGVTSAATGKVLGIYSGTYVLGRVTGTFVSGETLNVGGVAKGTSTSLAQLGGATDPSDNADYRLLAANDKRADIQKVPGSGAPRGGFTFNDITYAFRDNAGGTAGDLYKQTTGGWVQVVFGKEIQFSGATGQIADGASITGATSGATAVVTRAMLRSGTWTVAGAGTLIIGTVAGTFQNGENIQVGGVTKVVAASASTAITRLPGGHVETVTDNFTGSAATRKVYGCDGVNLAFEFDGTTYIPIRTGMTADTPSHIAVHRFYLFLSFQGSLQFSGVGSPYAWSVVVGAGEIAMGDTITALLPQTGNAAGASLAVFTKDRASILYGTSSSNFSLIPSIYELGYHAYTIQPVSNNTYGLTARGLQSLITTLNYGDFQFAALSFFVQPLIAAKAGLETCSVSLKSKNQYRIFFSDNTALVLGLTGEKISGILALDYGIPVRTCWNATLSTGEEVTYFTSDDGYVYKDNVGTSFDGAVIGAHIRLAFNNLQSPRERKQYRRAIFEVACEGYSMVNATYDLGYGAGSAEQAAVQADQSMTGGGGYWDSSGFVWDSFIWDSAVVNEAEISIDGTANNISFLFNSSRAQDDPHQLSGVSLLFTPRRLTRTGS
jgi:hypothetical protein